MVIVTGVLMFYGLPFLSVSNYIYLKVYSSFIQEPLSSLCCSQCHISLFLYLETGCHYTYLLISSHFSPEFLSKHTGLAAKIVSYRDAVSFSEVAPFGTLLTWALTQAEKLSDYTIVCFRDFY